MERVEETGRQVSAHKQKVTTDYRKANERLREEDRTTGKVQCYRRAPTPRPNRGFEKGYPLDSEAGEEIHNRDGWYSEAGLLREDP